jgi:hypothetical protein
VKTETLPPPAHLSEEALPAAVHPWHREEERSNSSSSGEDLLGPTPTEETYNNNNRSRTRRSSSSKVTTAKKEELGEVIRIPESEEVAGREASALQIHSQVRWLQSS